MTECKHGGKVKTDGGSVKCLTCIHDDAWKESALAENRRVMDEVEDILEKWYGQKPHFKNLLKRFDSLRLKGGERNVQASR